MSRYRAQALVAVATALTWSNLVLPRLRLGNRGRTAANAVFATAFDRAIHATNPDLAPVPWTSREGTALGVAVAAVPVAGYGVIASVPTLREAVAGHGGELRTPLEFAEWIGLHIPVGTVFAEETIFRGTLDPLLENVFGAELGSAVAALTFGLWHVHPARAAGDNVAATVVATAVAGYGFGLLRRRGSSLAAPALVHLAINVVGAFTTRLGSDAR